MAVFHIGRPLLLSRTWKGGTGLRPVATGELPETSVDYPMHGFTHVDAPCHMIRGGRALEDCDISQLCGPAALVDVSDTVPGKPVTAAMLAARTKHARPGDILILRSNLPQQYDAELRAYKQDSPWVDDEASRYIAEAGFKALAVDFPQDFIAREMAARRVENHEFTEHQIVLGAGLMHLEHLVGLQGIESPRAFLAGLPLRLSGRADGGPASPVLLTDCPPEMPVVHDLSVLVAPDHRGLVETFLTLDFEAGDPVQETGVRFAGHSHTHVLTPRYLDPQAPGIAELVGAPLVGDCAVLDVSDYEQNRPISREMLESRPAPSARSILIRTGFADRVPYNSPEYEARSPFLDSDAAALLVERGHCLVAFDFEADRGRKRLAGAPARRDDLEAERVLLEGGTVLVKNLRGTGALGRTFTLVAMPLLLPGAEAAPARVVGLSW